MTEREKLIDLLTDVLGMSIGYKADHLIANGVTFQKWVPVALGFMPEEHGRYLCVVKSFAFPGSFYQAILYCDDHGFREGNIYTDDVVYWMPLPEPPKEK